MSNTPGDHGGQGGEGKIPRDRGDNLGSDLGQALSHLDDEELGPLVFNGGGLCLRAPVSGGAQRGDGGAACQLHAELALWSVYVVPCEILCEESVPIPKSVWGPQANGGWDWEETSGASSGPWADASSLKASLSPSVECGVGPNDPKMRPNPEARYSGFTPVDT